MEKELLRSEEAKRITLLGFWINAALVVIKITSGVLGRSGAMVADGVHSLSDFLTDVVVLTGFTLAQQPEDDCHNYGHGKYETLAAAIIGIFLILVGFEIFKLGLSNIIAVYHGEALPKPGVIGLIAAFNKWHKTEEEGRKFLDEYNQVVNNQKTNFQNLEKLPIPPPINSKILEIPILAACFEAIRNFTRGPDFADISSTNCGGIPSL